MPSVVSSGTAAPTTAAENHPVVLVIDYDPAFLRSLTALLQAHRMPVATASDSAQAFGLFRQISPAVVLADLQDRVGTIMQMRLEQREVKMIAMSGSCRIGRMGLLEIAKELGADATLTKPCCAWDLAAMICKMLEESRSHDRRPVSTQRFLTHADQRQSTRVPTGECFYVFD